MDKARVTVNYKLWLLLNYFEFLFPGDYHAQKSYYIGTVNDLIIMRKQKCSYMGEAGNNVFVTQVTSWATSWYSPALFN